MSNPTTNQIKNKSAIAGTTLTDALNTVLLNVGTGAGDMLKIVYDNNNNGKVDVAELAEAVPWAGVTSKPATFPPQAHNHVISDVTNLQTSLDAKQSTLVSGTNIKTVNSTSLLGSGNIVINTTASGITNTPAGNIAATNVQDAINELDTEKLALTGGTLTGNLTVPSFNGGQLAGMRNKIINGKMEIAQRGTSFAAIASGAYSLDRWVPFNTSAAVYTVSQQSDAPSDNEFQNSLRVAITTADASIAAGDQVVLRQWIEGYNARDLIGRTFTVSFWVRSSKTGVHCVAPKNTGGDRSYVFEYTVSAANTWEKKTLTLNSGLITAGTWNWTNGQGLALDFTLAVGSTFQTTANAWQTGNFFATSNQVNCLDTVGNIFAITGVQLEVGSVATSFEHRPYGVELALCQRYYYRMRNSDANVAYIGLLGGVSATRAIGGAVTAPQPMRSTVSQLDHSGVSVHQMSTTNVAAVTSAFVYATLNGSQHSIDVNVASGLTANTPYMLGVAQNGFIGLSSEL